MDKHTNIGMNYLKWRISSHHIFFILRFFFSFIIYVSHTCYVFQTEIIYTSTNRKKTKRKKKLTNLIKLKNNNNNKQAI